MSYAFREFTGADADWPHYVRIHNLAWPLFPTTEAEARSEADRWEKNYRRTRFLLEVDGVPVGFGVWCDCAWSPRAGKYFVDWLVDPAAGREPEDAFGEFLLARVHDLGDVETLCAETRETREHRIAWLESHGFTLVHRENCSELNPQTWDDTPFKAVCDRVAAGPYDILDVAELTARTEDWFEALYDLNAAIVTDLPAPEPIVPESRERFRGRFHRPGYDPRAYFVAVDGDVCIGLSTLSLAPAQPHKLYVGLTGVRRDYRRRGLCTALKVRALRWARSNGYTEVFTDNEENNPMYQINLRLGFEPKPAWVAFQTGEDNGRR